MACLIVFTVFFACIYPNEFLPGLISARYGPPTAHHQMAVVSVVFVFVLFFVLFYWV